MANYLKHLVSIFTPQREKAREDQAQNNAGGFVFVLDKWAKLDRWLILGTEGGSYYATERQMTRDNAKTILECLAEGGCSFTLDRSVVGSIFAELRQSVYQYHRQQQRNCGNAGRDHRA